MSSFSQILWSIAGADKDVLLKCKTDQKKFANIGIVILLTSGVAFCAGSFAAYYFSCNSENPEGHVGYSILFGLLWSLLIFSIDRALVVTLQKKENGKRFWWLFPFLTRFFLAALIACMISIPIELFIFQDYIKGSEGIYQSTNINTFIDNYSGNSDINNYKQRKVEDEKNKNDLTSLLSSITSEIEQLDQKKDELILKRDNPLTYSSDYKSAYNSYSAAYNAYEQAKQNKHRKTELIELANKKTSAYNRQKEIKDKWVREHNELIALTNTNIDSLKNESRKLAIKIEKADSILSVTSSTLRNMEDQRNEDTSKNEEAQEGGNSFIRNYSILEWAVSKENPINQGKMANEGVFLWLIRLLFLIIEILPTIVKISTPYGAYDKAIEELKKYEENNFDPKNIDRKEKKKNKGGGFSNYVDSPIDCEKVTQPKDGTIDSDNEDSEKK